MDVLALINFFEGIKSPLISKCVLNNSKDNTVTRRTEKIPARISMRIIKISNYSIFPLIFNLPINKFRKLFDKT